MGHLTKHLSFCLKELFEKSAKLKLLKLIDEVSQNTRRRGADISVFSEKERGERARESSPHDASFNTSIFKTIITI